MPIVDHFDCHFEFVDSQIPDKTYFNVIEWKLTSGGNYFLHRPDGETISIPRENVLVFKVIERYKEGTDS